MKLGIIGGNGWLGRAMAQALLDAGVVAPDDLCLSYRSSAPDGFPGVFVTSDNGTLIVRSDVVILSVRPQDLPSLNAIAPGKLVISVMAGIPIAQLAARLDTTRIVRAVPNAAVEVRRSYTPYLPAPDVTTADLAVVQSVLQSFGACDALENEAQLDYFTGLTGSGPAFPALLADAMMRDAVARGIPSDLAQRAVTTLLVGTGHLFEKMQTGPTDMVTTFLEYRGTTASAILSMRNHGFDTAVWEGLDAALRTSRQLGEPF